MSGNVYFHPGPVYSCSVCAGNVIWRGWSLHCCTCSNWVHVRCSLLSSSWFSGLGSSHSCSCPRCHVSASPGSPQPYNTVTSSGPPSTCISTVQSGPSCPPLPMQHLHITSLTNILSSLRSLPNFSLCIFLILLCF